MVVLRAGLYERVSTEEQAKFGYSIRAQVDALNEYCKNNNIKLVEIPYTDYNKIDNDYINKLIKE